MAVEEVVLLAPEIPDGLCGSTDDRSALMAANMSSVIANGSLGVLPYFVDISVGCGLCLSQLNASLDQPSGCQTKCTTRDAACIDCEAVFYVAAVAYCNAYILEACSVQDFYEIINYSVADVATCVSANEPIEWQSCLIEADVNIDCAENIGIHITENTTATCGDHCTNTTADDCRVCLGLVAVQQLAALAPEVPEGLCGSPTDIAAIIAANVSAVVDAVSIGVLPGVANLSNGCTGCIYDQTNGLDASPGCSSSCTIRDATCLDCESVMYFSAMAYCNMWVWDLCTNDDYDFLAYMNITATANCITNEGPDRWGYCLGAESIDQNCAERLNNTIHDVGPVACEDHCQDPTSVTCRLCIGTVAVQRTAANAPEEGGSCSTQDDLAAIIGANISAVIDADALTALPGIANVSQGCNSCFADLASHFTEAEKCGNVCGEPVNAECTDCIAVAMMSAMAYCNLNTWIPVPTCTAYDYDGLIRMDPGLMATCLEEYVGDDAFVGCFGDVDTANVTDNCTVGLEAQIEALVIDQCATFFCVTNDSIECFNCQAAVQTVELFTYAPNASGACGNDADRAAIISIDILSAVGECGPYWGAMCAVYQAAVTNDCNSCMEYHTNWAVRRCSDAGHCDGDPDTGVDCLACVNVGLIGAAAHCNNEPWIAEPICSDSDYAGLERMNPGAVATCLEDNPGDGFVTCFDDAALVNMTEDCSIDLDGRIDQYIKHECNYTSCVNDSERVDCYNCMGAGMVQQVFTYAPEGSGACSGEGDRASIAALDLALALDGCDQAYQGGMCVATGAEVTEDCYSCMEYHTDWAFRRCSDAGHCDCSDDWSTDCLACVNVGLIGAAAHCNEEPWIAQPVCSDSDYHGLERMKAGSVKSCLEDNPGDGFVTCFDDSTLVNMTADCSIDLDGKIDEYVRHECNYTSCADDSESVECYNCMGAAMVQQVVKYAPEGNGSCGGDEGSSISELDLALALEGCSDPYSAAECIYNYVGASDDCQLCIEEQTARGVRQCKHHCSGNPTGPDCLECANIGLMRAVAHCNFLPYIAPPTCTADDYAGLDQMDAGAVALCLETVEVVDPFVDCFGIPDLVNMTEECSFGLHDHIQAGIEDECDTTICPLDDEATSLSADCLNCRGAVMVQETFEHAPEGTGACGDLDNRQAIADVDMDAVIACGKEMASTGATCLAFQAQASELCRECLELRTQRAMEQCTRHCGEDASGPDCMECVNIGLMSAAAHCNVHISGSVGMMGLSLIPLAALLAFLA